MRLFELLMLEHPSVEEREEARRIQDVLSRADVVAVPGGVRAMSE